MVTISSLSEEAMTYVIGDIGQLLARFDFPSKVLNIMLLARPARGRCAWRTSSQGKQLLLSTLLC